MEHNSNIIQDNIKHDTGLNRKETQQETLENNITKKRKRKQQSKEINRKAAMSKQKTKNEHWKEALQRHEQESTVI